MFDSVVTAELGSVRASRFEHYVVKAKEYADSLPGSTLAITHIPRELNAKTTEEASLEFSKYLASFGPERWNMMTAVNPSGKFIGMATEHQPQGNMASTLWVTQMLFIDLHTRLGSWLSLQAWRAAELSNATAEGLMSWHIIVASTCSRALLESAAAISDVSAIITEDWDRFKSAGVPTTVSAGVKLTHPAG